MEILNEVLERVKPSAAEAKAVKNKIAKFVKSLTIKDATIELGGSGAKGTWLKDVFDVDLFVRFNKKCVGKDISSILEQSLKEFKPEKFHGSRDYFQVKKDGFVYELVPVIKINKADEALNITDVSPLHAKWVNKKSSSQIKDQIRIAKQFFKANELYGAESYIKGFSGYVLEILVIYYDGFVNLLKACVKWKEKEIIDLSKFHKDVMFEVNSSKLDSPLIVIDPVQAGRNASAALSLEKFRLLKKLAQKFLDKPAIKYFEKEKVDVDKLGGLVIELKAVNGKEDIVGCKIEKAFNFFARSLTHEGFTIKKSKWYWDDTIVFNYDVEEKLSPEREIIGPPLKIKAAVKDFKKKYKKTFEKKGKIYAKIKRKYLTSESVVEAVRTDKYLKGKVKL